MAGCTAARIPDRCASPMRIEQHYTEACQAIAECSFGSQRGGSGRQVFAARTLVHGAVTALIGSVPEAPECVITAGLPYAVNLIVYGHLACHFPREKEPCGRYADRYRRADFRLVSYRENGDGRKRRPHNFRENQRCRARLGSADRGPVLDEWRRQPLALHRGKS